MTLEQCKKLKEWGLPQFKQSYFYVVYPVSGDATLYSSIARNELAFDWETVSCPDLEQLLEFADPKLGGGIVLRNIFGVWHVNDNLRDAKDPDLKEAVYKLLEKVLGEAPPRELLG